MEEGEKAVHIIFVHQTILERVPNISTPGKTIDARIPYSASLIENMYNTEAVEVWNASKFSNSTLNATEFGVLLI